MTIAALLFALVVTSNAEETREPVLLDFHASWCGPCKQMRPAIDQLVQKNYPVKSVDIDEHPQLAKRYQVEAVPTFVVIDGSGRELARSEGFQPALQLANLYLEAKIKVQARANPPALADAAPRARIRDDDADAEDRNDQAAEPEDDQRLRALPANPDPWKTVVRIKVQGNGSIGFGSGTIIYSDAEQAIILTCAHIFKVEGRVQPRPAQFNRRIDIDLFDGILHSKKPAQVHHEETVQGEAIDYDFDRDVGLIRIRPGRKLPASRVVPTTWTPRPGTPMTTVGCSQGHDATAWSTKIQQPLIRGLSGSPVYEAIECQSAPSQGRSGGGLYTLDGYVAGVCDFAEPRGDHGLYATPRSIYHILNRNNLTALYTPSSRPAGTLVAGNRPASAPKRTATAPSIARAQSPDSDDPNRVMMPPPELLGIQAPAVAQRRARKTSSRSAWHSAATESTDLKMAPEVDNDPFHDRSEPEEQVAEAPARAPSRSARTKWRPVRESQAPLSASNER